MSLFPFAKQSVMSLFPFAGHHLQGPGPLAVHRALPRVLALPFSVLGPVLFDAFFRLAWICASVAMGCISRWKPSKFSKIYLIRSGNLGLQFHGAARNPRFSRGPDLQSRRNRHGGKGMSGEP